MSIKKDYPKLAPYFELTLSLIFNFTTIILLASLGFVIYFFHDAYLQAKDFSNYSYPKSSLKMLLAKYDKLRWSFEKCEDMQKTVERALKDSGITDYDKNSWYIASTDNEWNINYHPIHYIYVFKKDNKVIALVHVGYISNNGHGAVLKVHKL